MTDSMEVDILVVGSGAAGLAAALSANAAGQEVLVVEKSDRFGGTTALSGGVMWIPNNSLMAREGIDDDDEQALTYLSGNIGNRVEPAKLKQFVRHAKDMLDSLVARGAIEVSLFRDFPDYSAEAPGGIAGGRSVEPLVLAGSKLGSHLDELHQRRVLAPGGIAGNMMELRRLGSIRTEPLGALRAWRVLPRLIHSRITGERYLSQGAALVGWLRRAIDRAGIPMWLGTPLKKLDEQDGRVVGAVVGSQGEEQRVTVRKGVIMASGGYDHNEQMRETYQGSSRGAGYTSGVDSNTGDGILAGQQAGAALDLMEDCWWAPTFLLPGGTPVIVIFERGKPGCIVVNGAGRRFANEALPYNEFVKRMLEEEQAGGQTDPAWFVFDNDYRRRYPVAGLLPGQSMDQYVEQGFVTRAETMEALQEKLAVQDGALVDTVERFNGMARAGRDEDFQRGETAFDRYTGDPTRQPNPCLAPLESAPFHAIRLYPGDLGTKGGLLTNEFAQVLRDDGTVVDGLYAAGNCSAAVMGHFYPGAGGTIGPAMTFGYIAARHAAGGLPD